METCEICAQCAAGKYKDVIGTAACRPCPLNTYNPDRNSKSEVRNPTFFHKHALADEHMQMLVIRG